MFDFHQESAWKQDLRKTHRFRVIFFTERRDVWED